jgi:alkylation response protein AidB-like acyl-CoA dehydrogenase
MTTVSERAGGAAMRSIDEAVRKYGPILRDEYAASCRAGALTEVAARAFDDGGFATLDLPESLGGYGEYGYADWARMVEEISRYDAGSGWVLHAVGGFTGLFAACLPEAGARRLWGEGRSAIIAGMAAPRGKAVRADGGWLVEGKFQFASGARVATHFTGGCAVHENGEPVLLDDGSPKFIGVVVPREQIVEQGNWDVFGLQATSSIDYEIPPTFVSDDFVISLNPWPQAVHRGSPRHRVGLAVHGVTGQPPVSLGAARRALEEIAALARRRKRRDGPFATVADQPLFRHDIASLEAELDAARFAYYDFVEKVGAAAANGSGPMEPCWGDRAKQVCRHALDVALECVDFAYYWSGTSGLRRGNVIGQLFLDVHAMNLHLVMDRNVLVDAAATVIGDLAERANG